MPTTKNDPIKEALKPFIKEVVFELAPELIELVREMIEAEEKHVRFTRAQLAEKWGCKTDKVSKILKEYHVKPIDKRGSEHEFDIEQAEEAKRAYNGEALHKHDLNWKMRATK